MKRKKLVMFTAAAMMTVSITTAVAASDTGDLRRLVEAVEATMDEAVAENANEESSSSESEVLSPELISKVQAALNNAGYDAGAVDGIMGPRTQSAIIAYSNAHGFESNGQITDSLLYELGLTDYSKISDIPSNGQDVQLLKDYAFANNLNSPQYHYLVIRNNTNQNLDVQSNSVAYDGNGEMMGFGEGAFSALGPGCISVMREAFEMDDPAAAYDTTLSSSRSEYPVSVLKKLAWKKTDLPDGAAFEVKNNNSIPAKSVEGCALFFKDRTLVDVVTGGYKSSGEELAAGAAVTEAFTTDQAFDRVDFYLTGTP